ncbi:MAG: RidA family protein [Christensenellales bacterium]|jgi:2-iminobutanoate/2-iminopropanoate deaminase
MAKCITSAQAPAAIGPYSQATQAGNMLFISGQLPIDPSSGAFPAGGAAEHATQSIANLKAILEQAGFGLEDVVKVTVFLKDLEDFAAVNEVYGKHFQQPYPARSTFQVARLPKDALLEIEAIAVRA